MDLPIGRWHEAVPERHSRRAYDGTPVEAARLEQVRFVCHHLRPSSHARAELVVSPSVDVFRGLLGSYGKVFGAPALLVFIAAKGDGAALRQLGYLGEGVVLEATALGLGT